MTIEILKQAPTFGIHGCKHENLDGILSGEGSPWGRGIYFIGHFFYAGEDEKRLPDKEFREGLESSVYNALAYSFYGLLYDRGKFHVKRKPCLVLLVETKEGMMRFWNKPRINPSALKFGSPFGKSFPIAEDMYKEFIDLKPITLDYRDMERISSAFQSYMRRKKLYSDSPGFEMSAEYFAIRSIVRLAIKRIADQFKPYIRRCIR